MPLIRREPELDLTREEIEVLKESRTPDEVKRFTARRHQQIGVRISAFRKVAAAARAEREAIIEVRALEMTRDGAIDVDDYRREVVRLRDENTRLLQMSETQNGRIAGLTALASNAQAISSSD